ncbi:MAG TPA: hypothetical protein VFH56_04860 [Acidimicrobiales bacterium]|nr:hypothetical protein [Acidimicrobiales bacterium]
MTFGSAADGLLGAVFSGLVALLLWWLGRRGRGQQVKDAWQRNAEQLRNELRRQYESEIQFLRGQCAAKDAESARKDAEITRLNKLLTRPRAGGTAHE